MFVMKISTLNKFGLFLKKLVVIQVEFHVFLLLICDISDSQKEYWRLETAQFSYYM